MGTERKDLNQSKILHDDNGLALIIVLGVVVLFSILASMLIFSTKIVGISSKVNTDRSRLKYTAESATALSQWLVMNYNFNNNDADLGIDDDEERWYADGQHHRLKMFEGLQASVKIYDVNRGWNISELPQQKKHDFKQAIGRR